MTHNTGNTLAAFFIGGLVGAGVALLFAPYSGEETRRKIADGAEDAGDWVRDRFNDAKYRVNENTDKVKKAFADKKNDLKAAYEAGKDAYCQSKERLEKEAGVRLS